MIVLVVVHVYRWLKNLNEYGICLLTDLPSDLGTIKEVIQRIDGINATIVFVVLPL